MADLRPLVELSFETLLDRIAAEGRDLDAWESQCLSAALIMMADDDYNDAASALEACKRCPPDFPGPSPALTIDDMRALYVMVKRAALENLFTADC